MNFIFGIVLSSVVVLILVLVPWIGVGALKLDTLFGVVIPYLALLAFFLGIIGRVIGWARSPVPFRIPTTAGQQWSLPWIKHSRLDNPKSTAGVVGRMIFEVLTFRSLFRNTKMQFRSGPKIGYEWEKWLWLFALAFHYSFLVVLIRHLRFFTEPIPGFCQADRVFRRLDAGRGRPLEGFMLPGVMISGFVLLGAATLLVLRRILIPQVNYISLPG
jgi:nitrate reductase gamma subunit